MSQVHHLKTRQDYFRALRDGHKNFEVRRNDRGYQRGDMAKFYNVDVCDCLSETCPSYTGPHAPILMRISYVFSGDPTMTGALGAGWVVLGLKEIAPLQMGDTDADN